MISLLKDPFFLILFIIMAVICVLAFKFTGTVIIVSAVALLFLYGWAKSVGSDALGLVPLFIIGWISLIVSVVIFLARL